MDAIEKKYGILFFDNLDDSVKYINGNTKI